MVASAALSLNGRKSIFSVPLWFVSDTNAQPPLIVMVAGITPLPDFAEKVTACAS